MIENLVTNSEEFIAKRLLDRPKVTNFFAATMKNARIEKNLTLAQAVSSFCSQSSWSKYENNNLSLPCEIIQSVCEGMGLDYQKLVEVDKINNLPDCMKYYLYGQADKVEFMYQNTNKEIFFSRDALINSVYYLMNKNYPELVKEIERLDKVKNTLSDYELLMFFVCTIEYYIQMKHFLQANKYLKVINSFPAIDKTLELFILQQNFVVSCHLRDYKHMHANYVKLSASAEKNYPFRNKMFNKLLFLEVFSSEESLNELDNMFFESNDEEFRNNYWYTRFIILIELGKFYEVIQNILSLEFKHISFVALLGYAISRLIESDRNIHDLQLYRDKFEEMNAQIEYKERDIIHLDFIKYLKVLFGDYDNNTDNELGFLRTYLIPRLSLNQHRLYSYVYGSRYTYLLGQNSKYKEAYLFAVNNCDLFKGLHLQHF